jgi:vitamin B12 transporter
MNLFKISCSSYFLLLAFTGFAQVRVDSVKQLSVVEVSSIRSSTFSSGNKTETIDSATLSRYSSNNLADVLANESQVFVKSYGLGSSAVTSFRGAGASHTAILWNGFNIQSPMLGLLDVSLVPANFINDMQLQYGGAGALWGSGAVGGTIQLNNSAQFNRGISVSATGSFGSFSDKQQQASIEISKKRFVSSVKFFNHDAKNNFSFINSAQYGKPEQKQSNAELKQFGFLQENYFRINAHQTLNTHFWYQSSDRNIPPSMTQNSSAANQKDGCYRATTEWKRTGEKLTVLARFAYFDEWLNFKDSTIHEDSKSRSKVAIGEVESRFSISKFDLINIGINNTYSEASTADYLKNPTENRSAVFASYKIHTLNNSWNAVLSARQEVIKNKQIPFTESVGIEGKLLKLFLVKGNVAKHYRLPTFNDLYWAGEGAKGNPDLKPESGWSEELSLIHKYQYNKIDWQLGATAFNRSIDNWIIWLPNQYNSWSPNNVLQVWSRGVEYKLAVNYATGKFRIQLTGMYNYILSTNEKSTTVNDVSVGKQLIYVPIQNAQGGLSLSYKRTSVSYTQVYTGYRYTTSDNTAFLKPYAIGNINIAQLIKLNNTRIKVFVQLNNIWQETYQVMEYRAMPLFNYQFGLSFYFNQPNRADG